MSAPEQLNKNQLTAVQSAAPYILVVAGAGSGKTKTLTLRIAHLLETRRVPAEKILALTFTNKAAGEMRRRLETQVGAVAKRLWVSTFHAYCLQFLKKNAQAAGLRPNFLIYDAGDQTETVSTIIAEMQLKEFGLFDAKDALAAISRAKNAGKSANDFKAARHNLRERLLGDVFEQYRNRLQSRNAVDFDDLLLLTLQALSKGNSRADNTDWPQFDHILVDEYQDTNPVQYALIRQLAAGGAAVFAVGDDDQSIYGWRGADVQNILNFPKDFTGCEIITLDRNYRSGNRILTLANAVIEQNGQRFKKRMFSTIQPDELPVVYTAENETEEMLHMVSKIESWVAGGTPRASIACIFRSNFHSRRIEETLRNAAIPYRLIGGINFFSRSEVKTALAYIRLAVNSADDLSFLRAVAFPSRGVGDATLQKLSDKANSLQCSLFEAVPYVEGIQKGSAQALQAFRATITDAARNLARQPLHDAARDLFDRLGFEQALAATSKTEETAEKKIKNVRELLQSMYMFGRRSHGNSAAAFLEYTMLFQTDEDHPRDRDKVILLTAHMAKGLEFERVYLCGLTDDSFPNARATVEGSLEEERRLFYVAMTRAKRSLFMSYPKVRMLFGKPKPATLTRFLEDVPPDLYVSNHPDRIASQPPEDRQTTVAAFFARLEKSAAGK